MIPATDPALHIVDAGVADLARLPALLAAVDRLCALAGTAAVDAHNFKLAVEEACINAMTHAYSGLPPGPMNLALQAGHLADGTPALLATLRYGGHAFDPLQLPEPDLTAALDDRQIGGLGVLLMRRLAEVQYQHLPDGSNHLSLLRRCAAPE